jgi:hypothetical protein
MREGDGESAAHAPPYMLGWKPHSPESGGAFFLRNSGRRTMVEEGRPGRYGHGARAGRASEMLAKQLGSVLELMQRLRRISGQYCLKILRSFFHTASRSFWRKLYGKGPGRLLHIFGCGFRAHRLSSGPAQFCAFPPAELKNASYRTLHPRDWAFH